MTISAQGLVSDVSGLVSLPEIAIRVNELVNDPHASTGNIGELIKQDPALSVRVLKVANSPFYGLSSTIGTITRAVTVLGTKQIRDLVLSTSAAAVFKGLPNELVSMRDFWRHSLYCGILAQILVSKGRRIKAESIFIAGLLHDIGQLVIFNRLPGLAHKVLLLVMESTEELEVYMAERDIMGIDHMQVGAELIRLWDLPLSLQECVGFHHEPERANNFPIETAYIHIANALSVMAELHTQDENEVAKINPTCWEITGLSEDCIRPALESAEKEIIAIESALFPSEERKRV